MQHEADGRRRRSANSRQRIVMAMLDLVKAGDMAPSADAVAAAAGVGRRTVFRLFSDMDSIYREMHLTVRERLQPIRLEPLGGHSVEQRLHALVDRRARAFEELMTPVVAAMAHRARSPALQASNHEIHEELRLILLALLPPDYGTPRWREALDATLSLDLWTRLRMQQQMDVAEATAVLHLMLDGLLTQR